MRCCYEIWLNDLILKLSFIFAIIFSIFKRITVRETDIHIDHLVHINQIRSLEQTSTILKGKASIAG